MKRSAMPQRKTPLRAGKPLDRTSRLSTASLSRSPIPRKAKTRRGEFTPATRDVLGARWGGLCPCCGLPHAGDREDQHRRTRGIGGSRDPLTASPANGLSARRACHAYWEANPDWARQRGYRVDQGQDPAT